MNRSQIESISQEITSKYFRMATEMTLNNTQQVIETKLNTNGLFYIRINEISSRWIVDEKPIWDTMTKLFVGLYSAGIPVSVVFKNDGTSTAIYVGCSNLHSDILKSLLCGCFPQIKFDTNNLGNLNVFTDAIISQWNFGGYLKGNPTGSDNFTVPFQIDSVIKGMSGAPWEISFFAKPISKTETVSRQQCWLGEASKCSSLLEISFSENDNNVETVTYKQNYYHSEQYSTKVENFCNKLNDCISMGEWCVTINFASNTVENTKILGGLLTSAFYGEESEPEPVHAVYSSFQPFVTLTDGEEHCHKSFGDPSYGINVNNLNEKFVTDYPKYGNYLSSKELAVFAAFPTMDTAGFTVRDYVNFDVNRTKKGDTSLGKILENGTPSDNDYSVDLNEFNRHCLVIGLTGSGKTNTIKSLICSAGKDSPDKKPFMIIEPAKKEYWELYKLGFDDLKIYSVGSNEPNSSRLCINPFERITYTDENGNKKSVSIQTHIDFVYAAFKASFIMYTPMPYVLEKSIYSIYEDYGWDIDNNVNVNGVEIYPTIEDLYFKIPQIVVEMGFDAKMRNDLIGSLQSRINSLRIGSKGSALNVSKSFPMEHLLGGNTIIEIEDIGDDDVKAFIISLLLIGVLEYRRQQEDCQLEVRHLLFIEEAHRLLKNVQSGTGENADPRGAAVEFFCNMLAEMRSKGQGFVVADQIPSKLAPDLIKNTNLKIVHRTVDEEERVLMGGAMNMTEEQIEAFSTFKQGVAAVYSEGDNRPKLVKPRYAGSFVRSERKEISRQEVLAATKRNCIDINSCRGYEVLTNRRSPICRACKCCCDHSPEAVLSQLKDRSEFLRFAMSNNPHIINTCKVCEVNEKLDEFISSNLLNGKISRSDAKNCLMNCLLSQWNLKEKDIKLFRKIERLYIDNYISK